MSYETLINALLEEGTAKSRDILQKAQAEAARLLEDARQMSETMERETDSQIRRDIAAQRTAILSRAALSGRHILLQARHEILEAVWSQVIKNAIALTGKDRGKVLGALLDELLAASPSKPLRAIIDRRERRYLEPFLNQREIPFEEQHRDDLLLGVELEANGEVLTNSLTTRLAKAKPELMIELNRLLFVDSGQQSAISNSPQARAES